MQGEDLQFLALRARTGSGAAAVGFTVSPAHGVSTILSGEFNRRR